MRLIRLLAFCVLLTIAGAGVAGARSAPKTIPPPFAPKSPAAARALKEQQAAIDLINEASQHVFAVRKSCRPTFETKSSETHDAPTQAVLDAIAALRRPATPVDAINGPSSHFGQGEVYVDYTRAVTAASGQKFTIVVSRSVRPTFRISASCLDAEHVRLLQLLKGKPPRLRSVTLGEFGKLRHGQEQNAHQPTAPQDGIYLFSRNADGSGGGGGGGDVKYFLTHGNFTSSGGGGRRALLSGLLPDGVASVTLQFAKTVSRGPYYKPTVFPSAFQRTVRVEENVLAVHVPREAEDAFPTRMIWRGPDGSVLRIVKGPR